MVTKQLIFFGWLILFVLLFHAATGLYISFATPRINFDDVGYVSSDVKLHIRSK